MNERIRNIISKTIHIEGGYINDQNDVGGETNYGISKYSFPQYDIPSLSFENAIGIGYMYFWLPCKLSSYTYDGYAWKCFDIAFNCGQQGLTLVESVVSPDYIDTALGEDDLCRSLAIHYRQLVFLRPRNQKFLKGWEARAQMKYTSGEKYYE